MVMGLEQEYRIDAWGNTVPIPMSLKPSEIKKIYPVRNPDWSINGQLYITYNRDVELDPWNRKMPSDRKIITEPSAPWQADEVIGWKCKTTVCGGVVYLRIYK